MLIKACDTSNEVRPTEIAEPWVDCLLEEYFMQSDREKREGLPVAPFMDRDKVTKPTAQIGFIKFVLIPMFETLNTVSSSIWWTPHQLFIISVSSLPIYLSPSVCLSVCQLFQQLEQPILQPLKASLEHYEQLKMLEELREEDMKEPAGGQQKRNGSRWQSTGGRNTQQT